MCHICGVTDGGLHHYDCPYDNKTPKNERRVIVETGEGSEKPTLPFEVKWRTSGGWITVK